MFAGLLHAGSSDDEAARASISRWERLSASPGAAVALMRMILQLDVRDLLPAIRVPTLVLYRTADVVHAVGSRYLGDRIADAKVVELPGDIYFPHMGDQNAITGEIEEFLTGVRPDVTPDRSLATVLFTDIVASTEHATELGDKRWTEALDHHDSIVSREVSRHQGRLVKSTGDGALATFDGPARAIRCAASVREALRPHGLRIRAGLHTGEIELRGDDIGGIGVHIASRVEALAAPDEILVSRTVTDLVAGSGIAFRDRGEHELKGVTGTWRVFAVDA